MLLELAVQNLVIVERARLTPGGGLTVISGETGAGKSLLLDALEMVCGGRCQSQLVGPSADAATVTAVIQVTPARARAVEAASGVASSDGQYLLRRRLVGGGRSQAWINDTPVTSALLRAAAAELIEVHAQHDALRLASPQRQLELLDGFGGLTEEAMAYRRAHERVLAAAADVERLQGGERESIKELDYVRFQLAEIDALAPRAGEFAELEARHAVLTGAGRWRDLALEASARLGEDDDAVERTLGRLAKRLAEAPETRLQAAARACQAALEQVRDACAYSAEVAETLAPDPEELARIGERIDAYQGLFRKHGDGDQELIAVGERLRARAEELSSLGERLAKAQAEREQARAQRGELGERLAKARAKAAKSLATKVHAHLAELGMPKAVLSLGQETLPEPGPLGTVRQELMVATNPGMPAGRLGDIASGGETARIALALAEVMAARDPIPVLVFDEVDSGVGGRLGTVIGAKLARLSRDRTVLAVTHTPQLAAAANRQYMVNKSHSAQRTTVTVTEISGEQRLKEISEMLGGGRAALDQARALLQGVAR